MPTTIIEPNAIERALFLNPPGSPADIAVHVFLALVCGLPAVGFFVSTAPWWRGEA